jgi:hypothetical protein
VLPRKRVQGRRDRFLVAPVLAAELAELRQLELLGVGPLVLGSGVVALFALGAFERDDDSLRRGHGGAP